MKNIKVFIDAILAGVVISIGGVVFLACDSKIIGACLFSVGLFAVCTMGFNLFTGKICYAFENKPSYLAACALIWLGNLVGTLLVGGALHLTRYTAYIEKAQAMAQVKLSDTWYSIFILAIGCNILIYLAVESYRNNPHQLGKYMGIFLGVVVFIMAGFEHCVANMFYFAAAGTWLTAPLRTLCYVIIMSLGNAVGGLLIPACRLICRK